jgi:hypothetical protein
MSNLPDFVAMDSTLSFHLSNGYVREPDRLWGLPSTAQEWAQVKYVLLSRIRAAVIAQKMIADLLAQTNRLKRELDAERGQ